MLDDLATSPSQALLPKDVQTQISAYADYMELRAKRWWPLLVTSIFMVLMGSVCAIRGVRIVTEQDSIQTYSTIVFNSVLLGILFLVYCSDNACNASMTKTCKACASLNKRALKFDKNIQWWANNGNRFLICTSILSMLMPTQGIVAIVWWKDVTISDSYKLPWQLNYMFGVGAIGYVLASLWLVLSAMSRPVRQTWHLREELIANIKLAHSAEEWDKLVEQLATTDHDLKQMWSFTHAGGLWCGTISACVVGATMAVITILNHYRLYGDYNNVLRDDRVEVGCFFVSTLLAAVLGLVLASTTFVSPFWFGSEAGPDAEPSKQCCILTTAIFSAHTLTSPQSSDARVERMRFTQSANQLSLGAKLFGLSFSQALVFRVVFQMGVAAPTILTALQAAAVHHGTTTTTTNTSHADW